MARSRTPIARTAPCPVTTRAEQWAGKSPATAEPAGTAVILAHSATKLHAAHDEVVVCGSHGGAYVGHLCVAAGVRAVLLNDAGFGRDGAGIAGLAVCEASGLAAAALAHTSCRIGDAQDALARGIVSAANAPARALGVAVGQSAQEAAACLATAPAGRSRATAAVADEHRTVLVLGSERLVLVDSNALVDATEDRGALVITGSHGALVGGAPESAGRAEARLFAFNDAGIGLDEAGLSRLPVLAERGIAGVCVRAASARIGDARSTLWDGVIGTANAPATALGARADMALTAFICALAGAPLPPRH